MKLLIQIQTETVQLLKFGNGLISSRTLLGVWLLGGIEVNPYY